MEYKSRPQAKNSLLVELSTMIAGAPGDFELQHHLFNWAAFISSFFMMLFVPLDLANQRFGISLMDFTMSIYFGIIFVFSRTKKKIMVWPFIISLFVFLAAQWFPLQGSNGPTPYGLTLVALVIGIVLKGRTRYIFLVIYLLLLTVLFILEYTYPAYLQTFQYRGDELIYEHAIALISCIIAYAAMRILFGYYAHEKTLHMEASQKNAGILAVTKECANRAKSLTPQLDIGMVIIDQQRDIIMDANETAQRLLGKSKADMMGISWSYFLPVGTPIGAVKTKTHTPGPQNCILLTSAGTKVSFVKMTTFSKVKGNPIRIETFWPDTSAQELAQSLEALS